MPTTPAIHPLVMSAVGGVVTIIVGTLLYWLKDAWASRKERTQKNEDGVNKGKDSQMELERRLFAELQKIHTSINNSYGKNKERIYELDKGLTKHMFELGTKVEVLSSSTQSYQKETSKLEGKVEALYAVQLELVGELKMTNAKFSKVFDYIDASPRATDKKVSGGVG